MVRGFNNIDVKVVQESLYACYQQNIARDGDFGPATEQAVKNAQTKINQTFGKVLSVDGRFGPITSSYFKFQAYDHNPGQNGRHTGICYYR
ncbi:peptidoglycan-binding domain-containing protein [Streptomyces sp. NPDC047453]|uniref:peptidoglycan-binding domain-containing protein n=1 Tax=Streptomyces sp. NPDC047453 TaxID=3154812 RepID=UPI0033E166A5